MISRKSTVRLAVLAIGASLCASLAGCNPYPLPGPLHYGRCGPDAHTESFPYAKEDRHAYGCRSDDDGFLESRGQGDKMRN